jgi:hypothetical protein
MKIRSVVAEFFLADGRTDRHDETKFFSFAILCLLVNADKGPVVVRWNVGKEVLGSLSHFIWSVSRHACRRPVAFYIYFLQLTRKYK